MDYELDLIELGPVAAAFLWWEEKLPHRFLELHADAERHARFAMRSQEYDINARAMASGVGELFFRTDPTEITETEES